MADRHEELDPGSTAILKRPLIPPEDTAGNFHAGKSGRRASTRAGRAIARALKTMRPARRDEVISDLGTLIEAHREDVPDAFRLGRSFAHMVAGQSDEPRQELLKFIGILGQAVASLAWIGLYRALKYSAQVFESFMRVPATERGIWVLGSARFPVGTPDYEAIRCLCRIITTCTYGRYPMVTGGGPGAMEAAAQGSCEGGGYAIAFSIRLKKEEAPNPYSRLAYPFRNINLRKMRLTGASRLTLTFPGGIGTLDEGWENACAVQNGLTEPFPMYVVGANFYLEPTRLQYRNMLRSGTISPPTRS